MFHRKLTEAEKETFRQWARDNYEPGKMLDLFWHPIVREEWSRLDGLHMTVEDKPCTCAEILGLPHPAPCEKHG